MPPANDDPTKRLMPLVSICVPAYNAEPFIAETLKSAINQDYPHTEIIVSDDASTDRTPEIIKNFESQGVRLLRQERNLRLARNINAAIRASSGKYICRVDADDLIEPNFISSMVPVMEQTPSIAFAHCACRLIDVNGKPIGFHRSIHGSFIRSGRQEWGRYVFGLKAVNILMIRRSAFEAVGGYDGRFDYTEDWKMARDLLAIGDVFYNDQVLASYRVHSVGKKGIRLLQARENLVQLEDMEQNWLAGIPHKEELLSRARRILAWSLVSSTAFADAEEARQVLEFLPQYGNFLGPRLLAQFLQNGGGSFYRVYSNLKTMLRQKVKKLLYK
jgi:glycosyltransferase involved in cell wall biosynthesis